MIERATILKVLDTNGHGLRDATVRDLDETLHRAELVYTDGGVSGHSRGPAGSWCWIAVDSAGQPRKSPCACDCHAVKVGAAA